MVSVGIVGAGFSGLCMGIKLKQAGLNSFTIFEAAADIGGTWRNNIYPGAACDVQSVMYCYSFEPYPFTQHYSGQEEILQYLHHCADKYQLWDHIQLKTRVTGAVYDDDRAVYCVSTAAGKQYEVQVLVLAQGPLSIATIPEIPGLSAFQGSTMHTAAWDTQAQLTGKKVAVVGTGASAIQVIPMLQAVAKELVVFQRTPAWVIPRKELMPQYAVPAAQHGNRLTLWLQRLAVFWTNELFLGVPLIRNDKRLIRKVEHMSLTHMKASIKDPKLRQQLTPTYSLGCKRILVSDDYYAALSQSNVKLVTNGLKQVHMDGQTLESEDGEAVHDVDTIVFATGFDVIAPLSQFDIRARGASLKDVMTARPEAYFGLAVAGFPNLFTLLGLNTGLGHHSVVFIAECQVNLIMGLIQRYMLSGRRQWVEVTAAAQHAFNTEIQRRLQRTVWLSGCRSWYLTSPTQNTASGTDSVTGSSTSTSASSADAGTWKIDAANSRNGGVVMWPGLCIEYWWRTLWPVDKHWVAGKALLPVASSGRTPEDVKPGPGGVQRKETALQELLAGSPTAAVSDHAAGDSGKKEV